jgi:hypothetical protein
MAADGHDRNSSMNGLDKRGARRISRAVVPHLKNVGVEIDACGKEPFFGLKSRVTHEERAQRPVLHEQD